MTVFWDIAPCSLVEVDDVLEVHTAYIFRAMILLMMDAIFLLGRRDNLKSHNFVFYISSIKRH
jgi:hypothetical protein